MPASPGRVLAGLGIYLFVLMITIIGASVSDALTRRGDLVPARRKSIRLVSMSIATVFPSIAAYRGILSWQSVAYNYRKLMFIPTQAISKIDAGGTNEFIFTVATGSQRRTSFLYVIPDHRKMISYLGMQGHAAIVCSDGNVYIPLHPVGTFSMTEEKNRVKRMADPRAYIVNRIQKDLAIA